MRAPRTPESIKNFATPSSTEPARANYTPQSYRLVPESGLVSLGCGRGREGDAIVSEGRAELSEETRNGYHEHKAQQEQSNREPHAVEIGWLTEILHRSPKLK
jgi:hypothetical protein